jgi:hypothetical protein
MTNVSSKIGDNSSNTGEGGMEILGHGVYSLPDAAKLTRLKPQRVREWFAVGRSAGARATVFQSDYQSLGGDRAISFHRLEAVASRRNSFQNGES